MIDRDEAEQLLADDGHLFAGDSGDLGAVVRVYLDEYTGWPSFATIESGAAGQETFVALHQAELRPCGVEVPYARTLVEQAPRVARGQDLTVEEEDALFDYYGVPVDGTVPSVAHLGTVLEPTSDGDDVTAAPVQR